MAANVAIAAAPAAIFFMKPAAAHPIAPAVFVEARAAPKPPARSFASAILAAGPLSGASAILPAGPAVSAFAILTAGSAPGAIHISAATVPIPAGGALSPASSSLHISGIWAGTSILPAALLHVSLLCCRWQRNRCSGQQGNECSHHGFSPLFQKHFRACVCFRMAAIGG
jgi:hypothetical protein